MKKISKDLKVRRKAATLKKAEEKNKGGRPPKYDGIDGVVVQKLVEKFKEDCKVEEACSYAGISVSSYYSYCKEHEGFLEEMLAAQYDLFIVAKRNVSRKIRRGNTGLTMWFLERRDKARYSSAVMNYNKDYNDLSEEQKQRLDASLESLGLIEPIDAPPAQ